MRKLLIAAAGATLIAAYFAPDQDGGVVGPAGASTRERPASAPAAVPVLPATPLIPAEQADAANALRIQARVADDEEELGNVFAKQSWQPEAPKKPIPAQSEQTAAAPAKPAGPAGAPPLPFLFMGRFVDEGKTAFFLQLDGRNIVAHAGDKIDERYVLDSVGADALHFIYLPLNQKQSLVVGDTN
ncbi:hypothetical protein ACFOLJ_13325 [Rugamonas sp. CCM 8940]|uniref:hypothetical protein n=1 Tax=Rugamonas sp. CCM 8940 TaxID=2765359 RepID=UPI0018F36474|nr:hypothetical protein [Rugamonas sp. CCM 8940]MBJ7309622.1 hypothetical protein [Rugamonas sp. CCM 8940]